MQAERVQGGMGSRERDTTVRALTVLMLNNDPLRETEPISNNSNIPTVAPVVFSTVSGAPLLQLPIWTSRSPVSSAVAALLSAKARLSALTTSLFFDLENM